MHNAGYYCYLNLFEGVSTSGSLSVHVWDTVCPVGPYFQPYQVETHTHKIVPAAVGALSAENERKSNQRCADYAMVWPIIIGRWAIRAGETHRSAVNTRRSNERSLLAPRVDGFVAPSIKCSVLLLVLDAMDSDAPINIRTSALRVL